MGAGGRVAWVRPQPGTHRRPIPVAHVGRGAATAGAPVRVGRNNGESNMTGNQTPPNMQSVPVVAIGLEQVYATLLEVRDDVRDLKKEIGELSHDAADDEQRIRDLENDRISNGKLTGKLAGIAATLGVVGGGLFTFLLSQIGG